VILLTLLLQVAAVVNPFVKIFDDRKGFLWPFLDYPMFSQPHFNGETVNSYHLVGLLEDGTQVPIQPPDLGLDIWQFEVGPVPAFRRGHRARIELYLRMYEARQHKRVVAVRLENHPWTVSTEGASRDPVRVLKEVRL
jgi:hypothetical protein